MEVVYAVKQQYRSWGKVYFEGTGVTRDLYGICLTSLNLENGMLVKIK